MHVLHRPNLPHAATIAAAGAALAIVLSLLLAGTLNDFASTSTSAGGSATTTPLSAQSTWPGAGWNLNPLTSLLRAPVPIPWTAGF